MKEIKVVGFDADDTLWVNETFFRESEDFFCQKLSRYETENKIRQELFKTEMKNLELYGYGVKGFVLSLMECALEISQKQIDADLMEEILGIAKDMLQKPVEILPGVRKTLDALSADYRLLLLTKGDLLDQERKLAKSGLENFFHHVEVLSDKKPKNYLDLLEHLEIDPKEFLMVGNSLKSDVLPLLEIGAKAVHVPFHTTWEHEKIEDVGDKAFKTIDNLYDLVSYLKN